LSLCFVIINVILLFYGSEQGQVSPKYIFQSFKFSTLSIILLSFWWDWQKGDSKFGRREKDRIQRVLDECDVCRRVPDTCSGDSGGGLVAERFDGNFSSRRWGSSLTVCARLNVCSSPHRHKRKFFGTRVCRVTFKHLPQPLRSHILSFGTIGQIFKIPPFSAQK
jgi:hypothetical protein